MPPGDGLHASRFNPPLEKFCDAIPLPCGSMATPSNHYYYYHYYYYYYYYYYY